MAGRCQKILVAVMLLSMSGVSLALLQTAAWAGMLASRAPTLGVAESVKSTFDGKHPCPLCRAVETSRAPEKKTDVQLKIPRLEFPAENSRVYLVTTAGDFVVLSDEFAESISSLPLLRPPRACVFPTTV
jgi:hypothetical protein